MVTKAATTAIVSVVGLALLALLAYAILSYNTPDVGGPTTEEATTQTGQQQEEGVSEEEDADVRGSIESNIEARIDALNDQVAQLRYQVTAKFGSISVAMRNSWNATSAELDARLAESRDRLQALVKSTDAGWEVLRVRAEASVDALERLYLEARADFK